MSSYQSDITIFLKKLTDKDANLKKMQKKHFNTWWNRPQNFDIVEKNSKAECPQKAYYYL
ncbi:MULTISPECIES: DUF3460 family protein [Candidatus Ichthyocystis]|uniref:Uncharacterized protein n=1 Tax=Candidatus Ichthyocystis hellenicum TaxID=1561003 RepID=A0A0S4M4P0_9BURK|nr:MULTISPECIES: DUF3460 family protein [Ichthyocystis]CUT17270.1 hypothetical protein, DUF3460 family [Candidatus Ichthyocystis hellenicum]